MIHISYFKSLPNCKSNFFLEKLTWSGFTDILQRVAYDNEHTFSVSVVKPWFYPWLIFEFISTGIGIVFIIIKMKFIDDHCLKSSVSQSKQISKWELWTHACINNCYAYFSSFVVQNDDVSQQFTVHNNGTYLYSYWVLHILQGADAKHADKIEDR